MNRFRSPRDRTGLASTAATAPDLIRMPTAIDLFEKARTHDRVEQLRAAREQDLMPYFRLLEGQAGPVVTMEGAERIQLGSNNYLGLADHDRVKQAARDALEQYGTALTGSRFLNGAIPLHLELEQEIADWMGTDDAARDRDRPCLSTMGMSAPVASQTARAPRKFSAAERRSRRARQLPVPCAAIRPPDPGRPAPRRSRTSSAP